MQIWNVTEQPNFSAPWALEFIQTLGCLGVALRLVKHFLFQYIVIKLAPERRNSSSWGRQLWNKESTFCMCCLFTTIHGEICISRVHSNTYRHQPVFLSSNLQLQYFHLLGTLHVIVSQYKPCIYIFACTFKVVTVKNKCSWFSDTVSQHLISSLSGIFKISVCFAKTFFIAARVTRLLKAKNNS